MSQEQYFSMLAPALQRWAFRQGWKDLNEIQKAAFTPILEGKSDVIISASTAGGKTEAAFLPALTSVINLPCKKGISILCISPLKALINDQYRRLDLMTADLEIGITPWHGDISEGLKEKLLRDPNGVILTTPESLESMLINRTTWLKQALSELKYVIIDEFHAFMGVQRGYQLQSQLHRIENLCGRQIPRIALSATFAQGSNLSSHLRPRGGIPCKLICSQNNNAGSLALQLRGYRYASKNIEDEKKGIRINNSPVTESPDLILDLFRLMRGNTNLVFCNSRFATEELASSLQKLSADKFVPNEFFPHHGSLSRHLRESLEHRLIEGRLPTTAVCTATLELGIDISDVSSIAQIEPPLSVASMRQRLGRSGRRDHKAVLRLFIPEIEYDPVFNFGLFENIFLSAAMVNLLLNRWYEPPIEHEYAFSTLLQQTLSVIASFGSVSAEQLYELLCNSGPFILCTKKNFAQFLRDLGTKDLITQLNDGSLTLGLNGENLVSDWKFYTAFSTPVEYSIENDGHVIGTAPSLREFQIGDTFTFGGYSWVVVFFHKDRRVIGVKKYPEPSVPLLMNGGTGNIHDKVYQEVLRLYNEEKCPAFLNKNAASMFKNGIDTFNKYCLQSRMVINAPAGLEIYPWRGDRVIRTMILMLKRHGIKADQIHSHIFLKYTSIDSLKHAVYDICKHPEIDPVELVSKIGNLDVEKNDQYIGSDLKKLSFAWSNIDVKGALECFLKMGTEF